MTVISHVGVLQCVVVVYYYCNTLQHIYYYKTLQHTATHCNTLQHIATHCNKFTTTTHCLYYRKHVAVCCNTLQHTATHCNTLQQIYYYNTLPLLQETAVCCIL